MRIKKRSYKHFNGVAENDDGPVEGGAFIYVLVIYYLRNETMIFFLSPKPKLKILSSHLFQIEREWIVELLALGYSLDLLAYNGYGS